MTRARASWISLLALAALLITTTAHAQPEQKEAANFALTGAIVSVDVAGKTITVKGANDDGGLYVVNDDTTIMNGDKKIALGDLKKGWRVVLNGDSGLGGGKKVVTYMEVVDTTGQ